MMETGRLQQALEAFEKLLDYIPRSKKALAFNYASEVEIALRSCLRESKAKEGKEERAAQEGGAQ